MGHRANLVVIEGGKRTLYYDHWCASTLDVDLFWGPQLALEFIRQREAIDEREGWLDTIWCEGAVALDLDRSVLLWFGGEDVAYDVPLRRAHLELMREVWRGWEVRWADEGILSIADALQLPRALVQAAPKDNELRPLNYDAEYPEYNSIVVSLRCEDGELLVTRLCGDEEGLQIGELVIDVIVAHASVAPLVWDGSFPDGGIHVDRSGRTVDVWWASRTFDLARVREAWVGWDVRWHGDRYERHFELAAPKLGLPVPAALRSEVLDGLERNLSRKAVNFAREAVARYDAAKVELNPATDSVRGSVGLEDEKRALLASLRK